MSKWRDESEVDSVEEEYDGVKVECDSVNVKEEESEGESAIMYLFTDAENGSGVEIEEVEGDNMDRTDREVGGDSMEIGEKDGEAKREQRKKEVISLLSCPSLSRLLVSVSSVLPL